MNEKDIRKIVQEEMNKNYRSGSPMVPRHIHDGTDGTRINAKDIIPANTLSGSINMSGGTISGSAPNQTITWKNYYLPVSSTPTTVKFYGGALNTTASPTIHAVINGECSLVQGYQYQPGTSNSVIIGNVPVNFPQGSGAMITTNGVGGTGAGGFSIIRNSQSYIAFASDASNNIYAVARVYSLSNNTLTIQVACATNWSLSGEWIIN